MLQTTTIADCLKQGNLEEGLSLADQLLGIQPHNAEAWHLKGKIYEKQGDRANAIVCFKEALTEVYQIQTSSGTVTAALQINGTNITGLSSISVTSTPQNVVATGANTVAVGNTLSLVFSSNASAANISLPWRQQGVRNFRGVDFIL